MRTLALYLTGACNLRCKHCSVGLDQYDPRPTLTDDELEIVVDRAAERGVKFITLLGGEPTFSGHNLLRLANYCVTKKVSLSVNTNLHFMERLSPLLGVESVKNIVVSLDGSNEATHNANRGKGSFQKTIANLSKLIKFRDEVRNDITIDVTFSLSNMNLKDCLSIMCLANEFGLNSLNINFVQFTGRAKNFVKKLKGSDVQYLEGVAQMIAYFLAASPKYLLSLPLTPAAGEYIRKRYGLATEKFVNSALCGGTSVYTYVDQVGNLLPCPGFSFEEGRNDLMNERKKNLDLIKKSIVEIESASIFKSFETERKKLSRNTHFEPCVRCKFKNSCSPCTSKMFKANEDNIIELCSSVEAALLEQDLSYDIFEKRKEFVSTKEVFGSNADVSFEAVSPI